MIGAWTVVYASATPCEAPATFQDLSRVLLAGEQAIRTADRVALEAAEMHAEGLMNCLAEPIGPAEVASFMRLKGIAWFVRKDRELALRWIESEVRLVPGASAGARVWLGTGQVLPFVGASLVGTSQPGRPLALGALGAAGVRVGEEQFVELGLRSGWSAGPVAEAGLGWGFALR